MTLWVAYTSHGGEFSAQEAAEVLGLQAWVPRVVNLERSPTQRRWRPVVTPYLPRYLFIEVPDEYAHWLADFHEVRNYMSVLPQETRAVHRFIAQIEADYADRMARIDGGERIAPYDPGDLLEITTGPFAGQLIAFGGMVERAEAMAPLIGGTIELMGRAVAVEIDMLAVRKAV